MMEKITFKTWEMGKNGRHYWNAMKTIEGKVVKETEKQIKVVDESGMTYTIRKAVVVRREK